MFVIEFKTHSLNRKFLKAFAKLSMKSSKTFQAWVVIGMKGWEAIVPELPMDLPTQPHSHSSVSVSSNFFQVCGLYGVWPNSHLKALRVLVDGAKKIFRQKFLKMQPHTMATLPQWWLVQFQALPDFLSSLKLSKLTHHKTEILRICG